MSKKRILHLGGANVFMPAFLKTIEKEFDVREHLFILIRSMADQHLEGKKNVILFKVRSIWAVFAYLRISIELLRADKVFLHGLNDSPFLIILWVVPFCKKKLHWIILGGDLYAYKNKKTGMKGRVLEYFRGSLIRRVGNIVTYIKGDVELARQWYGAKGRYLECLMYPSNIYKEDIIEPCRHNGINILIGNSADPSNNHLEILEKLEPYKNKNIKIYAPLTYGDKKNKEFVIAEGKKRFGDKFIPLTKHRPVNDYLKFLAKIDIAIFNHSRQQAMGNTITLLGLGKKVYMRRDVTQWDLFSSLGVSVYDVGNLCLTHPLKQKQNCAIIKRYFSESNYKNQLNSLFNDSTTS